ncbi:hypothetical protein ACFSR7_16030 [Cohnella sp. GCM10020058]|uniref:hypothetical protein n=1 Tax=Cohnella sp. GCM10020058 TaxID=3317330 RepID=UPI003636CA4C
MLQAIRARYAETKNPPGRSLTGFIKFSGDPYASKRAFGMLELFRWVAGRKACTCTGIFFVPTTRDGKDADAAGKFNSHAANRVDGGKYLRFCIFSVQKGRPRRKKMYICRHYSKGTTRAKIGRATGMAVGRPTGMAVG